MQALSSPMSSGQRASFRAPGASRPSRTRFGAPAASTAAAAAAAAAPLSWTSSVGAMHIRSGSSGIKPLRTARPMGARKAKGLAFCQAGPAPMSEASVAFFPGHDTLTLKAGEAEIILETNKIGRQANGAIMATQGETMIYTTACCGDEPSGDGSFLPLTVNYGERFSAAGKTAGGFIKRDGKQKDPEVLISRLIDRPLRPMFVDGWCHETQVLQWVMSYDNINAPEPLAITAAGAALAISDIPLAKPVAGVRVGLIDGKFLINPTIEQMAESTLDLMMAGTEEAILMIEGFADFLTEEQMIEAVGVGAEVISGMCKDIREWADKIGKPKRLDTLVLPAPGLFDKIQELVGADLKEASKQPTKQERSAAIDMCKTKVVEAMQAGEGEEGVDGKYAPLDIEMGFKKACSKAMRNLVLEEGIRADGRGVRDVRSIVSEAGLLPRTHGSALFTRGETQALCVATLGGERAGQKVDSMSAEDGESRGFYLQYFFPPSSVGETGRTGGANRRELGHGMLAERALTPIVPEKEDFMYTIRIESNITESNGSSSMASVCGGCLAMMDAGVPVKRMVAGVAMGLVLEPNGDYCVLTDILGSEDALGDMDFKVAGDEDGITAFQMDIKVEGITLDVMREALAQAKEGRVKILGDMAQCSPAPKNALSASAPRMERLQIDPKFQMALIGPAGKVVKAIIADSGCDTIDIDSEGNVMISGPNNDVVQTAIAIIKERIYEPEVGEIFRNCAVKKVTNFGCFVEIAPGKEGLVHVSELDTRRTEYPEDDWAEGDVMDVQLLGFVQGGKLKLSRRAILQKEGPGGGNKPPPPPTPATAPPPKRAGG